MSRYICHHDGKFFEWCTIVDAPVTSAMTRQEFEEYYRDEYGRRAMSDLPRRIERAIEKGTSEHGEAGLRDLIEGNRAGEDETELTFDDVIALVNES